MKNPAMVVLAVVIVVIGGIFLFVKKPNTSSTVAAGPKTFTLVVKNRHLVSGPSTLNAVQGDQVTINITVDEGEELHLHGYDKMVDLTKDQPGTLSLTADQAGHFPFELEHSKTELGALDVQPK